MKKEIKTKWLGVRISIEQHDLLEKYADQEGVNVATIIRWLIDGKIIPKKRK